MKFWTTFIDFLPDLCQALLETLYMVTVSMSMALLIGLPMGTLIYLTRANGIRPNSTIHNCLNSYVNIIRAVPFLLFVIFLMPITFYIFGQSLGPIPTPFPLSFIAIAIYARLVEQSLLEIPQGIIDTGRSMGTNIYNLITNFLYVEARSGLVLSFIMATISIISYSTVMGVVGGGGIGDFAMYYGYQRHEYGLMNVAIVIMIIIVLIIQMLGSYLAKVLDKKQSIS